jgi:hypothetical protein
MDVSGQVCVNPLSSVGINAISRPEWMCTHPEARIVNPLKKTFSCKRCNKNAKVVKKVKQSTMVGVMQNGELPPSPK